ncbi:polysaccharide deacetylase family protein [Mesobacillus campisalis]|uniref:polysaccharide deacetylase family protein n=1 Tax=Mesobacillus campisalis TaxID=1408103 RepID=UPI00069B50FA|nr:polysaccharide deacetylase family protein [Mesobacillus campisalis]
MKTIPYLLLCVLCFFFPAETTAQKRVPILIYHSIDEYTGQGSKELYVTPKNFEDQMNYLRTHGFTPLTFEQWERTRLVSKPIFITIDDGYKNNLNAFSILQKLESQQFQPKATLFVISDFIGRPGRLSRGDLKRFSDSGIMSIQSHTATHPDLTKITQFDEELKDSRDKIREITGRPVIALAYPYGNFNAKVVAETKQHYLFGLTTTPGPYVAQNSKDELYLLPRMYVKYSTSLDEFARLVEGE